MIDILNILIGVGITITILFIVYLVKSRNNNSAVNNFIDKMEDELTDTNNDFFN